MSNDLVPAQPLCFVLMPVGSKPDPAADAINFDDVYSSVVKPAIEQAGMEPIRPDDTEAGIDRSMLERLILCDYAVVDLTAADTNVVYQLGVRQGVHHRTTVPVFAVGTQLPPDLDLRRSVTYALREGSPASSAADARNLAAALIAAKADLTGSSVFQVVTDLPEIGIKHLKTDLFRQRVSYDETAKAQLSIARIDGKDAVDAVRRGMGPVDHLEAGVAVDLLLSYRAVGSWDSMIDLVGDMSDPVRGSVLVQEQLGLALNRAGRGVEAERVLLDLIDRNGPSSETYAILGRVYTDRWDGERKNGDEAAAHDALQLAIKAYRLGFETDWRDAYPGINAVRLMELAEPPDPDRNELRPVVHYSAIRRIAEGNPNYWDHATLLELAVLDNDEEAAWAHAADAVASVEESWQPETTVRNLRRVHWARHNRDLDADWLLPIVKTLEDKAAE